MEKKYELLEETIIELDSVLHRIKALKDFGDVKKGDLGGWIESEKNLSQEGTCWVYDEAKVCDNAVVKMNSKIQGTAMVFDNALVDGNSIVRGKSRIFGNATLNCNAIVIDNVVIRDNAIINGIVKGDAVVAGNAYIYERIRISGDAVIRKNSDYFEVSGISENYDFSNSIVFCKSSKPGLIKVCLTNRCIDIEEFKNILKIINDHTINFMHYEKYLRIVNMAETFLKND